MDNNNNNQEKNNNNQEKNNNQNNNKEKLEELKKEMMQLKEEVYEAWAEGMKTALEIGIPNEMWIYLWRDLERLPQQFKGDLSKLAWQKSPKNLSSTSMAISAFFYH